jgi:carboxyl-terminal processing protease
MKRARWVLVAASGAIVFLLAAGGLLIRTGAADSSFRQAVLFSEVMSLVLENYVDPVDQDSLLRGAFDGLLGGLDAHGAYLAPVEVEAWKKHAPDGEADTGLSVLKLFGVLDVVDVAPGSPAEAAGINRGDQIRRIDGRSPRELSLDQVRRLLRGDSGTTVQLAVFHPQEGFRREIVTLKREVRRGPAFGIEVRGGVVVLTLGDLRRVEVPELFRRLRSASAEGPEKLMIDLRNATEATPKDAARIAELFVSGELLVLKDRSGKTLESLRSKQSLDAWNGPLGVLVNPGTAGGAEALAEVLRARRQATVYGETTYGLGAEPKLFDLPDGSGMLISAAVWEVPGGTAWNDAGIKPDRTITVQARTAEADAAQLTRALEEFTASAKQPLKSAA